MPNQYTKFQAAAKDPTSRAFTFREWNGKKQKKPKAAKKKDGESVSSADSLESRSSVSHSPSTDRAGDSSRSHTPPDSLLRYRPSGGLRIDPFTAYPVIPNHAELAVIDHYFYVLAPSGKQNDVVLHARTAHIDPHVNLLYPYVMHHAFLFDAMIATCQASMALSSGISAYNDLFFMAHRGRAISGLRQKLEEKPDTTTLLCIAMLITCDFLLGDIKAVALHTNTLKRLIETLGHLPEETEWDRFVKHGVEAYQYVGFMATGIASDDFANDPLQLQVDPFKDLEYPEPFDFILPPQHFDLLPVGFNDLIMSSQISTQLYAIISNFAALVVTFDNGPLQNLRVLHPVQAALQRFTQHRQASYLERCVAAGLLAYTFQYPRIQLPNMFHDPALQGMIRLFSVSHRPRSEDERALLIWAMVISQSFMWARASPLPQSREVFARFVKREPSMRDWWAVEEAICRFFWTPSLLERWRVSHEQLLGRADRPMRGIKLEAMEKLSLDTKENLRHSASVCPFSGNTNSSSDKNAGLCPFSGRIPG